MTPSDVVGEKRDDSAEEYYCKRDEFLRYVIEKVNPARKAAGLNEINQNDATVCYRIINDFAKQWGKRP